MIRARLPPLVRLRTQRHTAMRRESPMWRRPVRPLRRRQAAADALVAEGVDAVFTPQDNTVMTAELAIFEKFIDAGIPHYTGADSFALNGAFCGYGVNYEELGTKTADMAVDILVNGADPAATPIETLERGIVTVNTETAEALGLDYSMFKDMCSEVIETVTAEEFE